MGSDLIRLSALLDDAKCFDLIRQELWRNLGDEVVRRRCVMSAR
jgi:hypothetical protein